MSEYFPAPKSLRRVKVELYLCNYGTKQIYKMQQELIHHRMLKR